jgi:hypothetical protein
MDLKVTIQIDLFSRSTVNFTQIFQIFFLIFFAVFLAIVMAQDGVNVGNANIFEELQAINLALAQGEVCIRLSKFPFKTVKIFTIFHFRLKQPKFKKSRSFGKSRRAIFQIYQEISMSNLSQKFQ